MSTGPSSGSIWPALVSHAVADSIVFVGAQSGVGPEWLWSPPLLRDAGVDAPFIGTVAVAALTGLAVVVTLRRLRAARA